MHNAIRERLRAYLIMVFGLGLCLSMMLYHLGRIEVAPWDEIVHLNVVHNLYTNCCIPKLHTLDLGTDFEQDTGINSFKNGQIAWNNNYIWLHKPLLPFYLRAAMFRTFGESLLVFRLPSVIFALMTSVSLFFIAKYFSSTWLATGASLLIASNEFVFDLAQGRQFSDLSDEMNLFFLTLVLALTLLVASGRLSTSRRPVVAYWVASLTAALFTALAYSAKAGLALPGLGVFALALLWQCGWRRGGLYIVVMALFFAALTLPASLFASHLFPVQAHYEQRMQFDHLFTDVEGWKRPWFYYISNFWEQLFGFPLGVLGFLAIFASFRPSAFNRRNAILTLWVLCYIVPLSFGVSKTVNFILPVLPAVILLVAFTCYDLIQSRQWKFLIQLSVIMVLVVLVSGFNISKLLYTEIHITTNGNAVHVPSMPLRFLLLVFIRFAPLLTALAILLITLYLPAKLKLHGFNQKYISPRYALPLISFLCIAIYMQNLLLDWQKSNSVLYNNEGQMALKSAAESIKNRLPQNAVVLVDQEPRNKHQNFHLYFQYWSGINAISASQLAFAQQNLSSTHPLYLLTGNAVQNARLIEKVPYGYLYKLDK